MVLWAIASSGFLALPGAYIAVAFLEAFVASAGINYALADVNNVVGEKLAELIPKAGLSPRQWTALITTVIGVTVFSISFLLLSGTRIGRVGGAAALLTAGLVGISVLVDRIWPIKAKSTPTLVRSMPLMNVLFLKLLQRIALRFGLYTS